MRAEAVSLTLTVLQPVFVLNSGYDPVSQLWQYSSLEDASDPAHSATVRDASWSPCLGDFSTCNDTQLATVQHYHSLIVQAMAPATDPASCRARPPARPEVSPPPILLEIAPEARSP